MEQRDCRSNIIFCGGNSNKEAGTGTIRLGQRLAAGVKEVAARWAAATIAARIGKTDNFFADLGSTKAGVGCTDKGDAQAGTDVTADNRIGLLSFGFQAGGNAVKDGFCFTP